MKLNVIAIALTTILFSCSQNKNTQNVTLEDEIDSTSFAIGVSVGENLNNQFDELDFELVNAGLNSTKDTSNNFGISSMVAQGIIQRYMTKKQLEKQKEVDALKNIWFQDTLSIGDMFTTESGIKYQILVNGSGAKPTLNDQVETHYHGTLLDGTVFDSSIDRGETVSFPVSGVIPGWTEALQLMSVGSKWKLIIPSELAYGERGAGQMIPPNSDLIFIVELVSIK